MHSLRLCSMRSSFLSFFSSADKTSAWSTSILLKSHRLLKVGPMLEEKVSGLHLLWVTWLKFSFTSLQQSKTERDLERIWFNIAMSLFGMMQSIVSKRTEGSLLFCKVRWNTQQKEVTWSNKKLRSSRNSNKQFRIKIRLKPKMKELEAQQLLEDN